MVEERIEKNSANRFGLGLVLGLELGLELGLGIGLGIGLESKQ
jgi:hypothetical protein